jgi:hypothetical protein
MLNIQNYRCFPIKFLFLEGNIGFKSHFLFTYICAYLKFFIWFSNEKKKKKKKKWGNPVRIASSSITSSYIKVIFFFKTTLL